jgi:pimeloyl-ACP methyl ester carboxylesterase
MGMPETRYARSGDVAVAYQVLGEGPFDVVFTPGTVSHIELYWDAAGMATWLRGIAEHARLIVFDKRGTGLSDRDVGAPTLEDRSDDIRAVMDAAGRSARRWPASRRALRSAWCSPRPIPGASRRWCCTGDWPARCGHRTIR